MEGELIKVSTLQCGSIMPIRQCGNTTRQVDWAVQQLYSGNKVAVQDHYEGGRDRGANDNLFKLILGRLTPTAKKSLLVETKQYPRQVSFIPAYNELMIKIRTFKDK